MVTSEFFTYTPATKPLRDFEYLMNQNSFDVLFMVNLMLTKFIIDAQKL